MIKINQEHSATDNNNWRYVRQKFKTLDDSITSINGNLNPLLEYDFSKMQTDINNIRKNVTSLTKLIGTLDSMALRKDGSRYMYNDVWFTVRNNAGSGNINIFKVNASDEIQLGCGIYADDWDNTNSNIILGVGAAGAGNLSGATYTLGMGYQCLYDLTGGDYNIALGYRAGYKMTTASHNVCIGYSSGYYNQTGTNNIFIGTQAGYGTSGNSTQYNVFIGYQTGYSVTTGTYNFYIGYQAGRYNTTGYYNVGMGYQALFFNVTGVNNVAIGYLAGRGVSGNSFNSATCVGFRAGQGLTTGANNVLVGDWAGNKISSGGQNTVIGSSAANSLTTASYNVIIGYGAAFLSTGSYNTTIGPTAMYYNETGAYNTAIGYRAGLGVSGNSNSNNTFIGTYAGEGITTGGNNVIIGFRSAYSITSGGNNVVLGYEAGYTQAAVSGNILIGYQAGYYETAGDKFYVTNIKGADEAGGRSSALLYGVMDSTTANQTLLVNAVATFTYFPVGPSSAPTTDYQFANKKYVDDFAGADANAVHVNAASEISALTEKASPVSADLVIIEDSADSNNKKKVQVGNLPGGSGMDSGVVSISADSDAVDVSGYDDLVLIKVDTSGGNVTIGGLSGGSGVKMVTIIKGSSSYSLIIEHNEASGTEKIIMHDQADLTLAGTFYGGVLLMWNDGAGEWREVYHD